MLSALRSRGLSTLKPHPPLLPKPWNLSSQIFTPYSSNPNVEEPNNNNNNNLKGLLDLSEVEKVLTEVRADDVRVIPVAKHCDWTDFMVVATGRSTWHVKNIAQALVYKAKQKQKGMRRMVLPSVEGQEGGKWIVIDSGKVIIHALEEKARAYYDLENLFTAETSQSDPVQDLGKAFIKIRPKNNSKKPAQTSS